MGFAIRGSGAVTAGGPTLPLTVASIHAGLQLFGDTEVLGGEGHPVTGALTPLDRALQGAARVAALGRLALAECAAALPPGPPVPLIVCAPDAADLEASAAEWLDRLAGDALPIGVDWARSQVIARGRDSIGEALSLVDKTLAPGGSAGCYLLGADSLVSPGRLKRLVADRRVIEGGRSDGFVPGEGAAALFLTPGPPPPRVVWVAGTGAGRETDVETGGVTTGRGISTALAQALAASGTAPRALVALVHDLSGPYAGFEEWIHATARAPLSTIGEVPVWQLPVAVGEIGAATGALMLAALALLLEKEVARGPVAGVLTSAGTNRSAVVLIYRRDTRSG